MTEQERSPLSEDTEGSAAIEFALISPVLLMIVFGLFDLGHNMYTASMLEGAIQQAARNSTIEGAADRTASLDQLVTKAVKNVSPLATLQFSRKSYTTFSDVSEPEDFIDVNGTGRCDNGETFEDANGNGRWDADRGRNGHGGARDAVLYSVQVTYPRMFPIARFIPGQSSTFTMNSDTVLRNQPYGLQNNGASVTGTCL